MRVLTNLKDTVATDDLIGRIPIACKVLDLTLLRTEFLEKNSENAFSLENGRLETQMIPSESAPQEFSNEWSCQ
jgi:hypothetical protein